MRVPLRLPAWLLLPLCLPLGACGAGLVTAAMAGNGSDTPPPQLQPEQFTFPLVPGDSEAATARQVTIANVQVPSNANLRVQLEADSITQDQDDPVVLFGQGSSTVVSFTLRTNLFTDPPRNANADLSGFLVVLIDSQRISAPATLLRQPTASLTTSPLFVSPLGDQDCELRIDNLREPATASPQMFVITADPERPGQKITRACATTSVTVVDSSVTVRARPPTNTFAGQATLFVQDRLSGHSTEVDDVYYRPELTVAVPAQGVTTGGDLVMLVGRALVPLDATGAPDFSAIEIVFHKGHRELLLPATELRTAESALDRLVLVMPPSPDGRPGNVDIELRARVRSDPERLAVVSADDRFLFGNPRPGFGLRGVLLRNQPITVVPLHLESPGDVDGAHDFGVLSSEGNLPSLQLMAAQDNGMFIPFGPARRIGDPNVPGQMSPRDLLAGEFDPTTGQEAPDFFVLNAGAGAGGAMHQVVAGQLAPYAPIGRGTAVAGEGGMRRCLGADFDRDGLTDSLLIAEAAGTPPHLWLARPVDGAPGFTDAGPLPVRLFPYDAVEIADLDGDGHLDVAVLGNGVPSLRLDVTFGNGVGVFGDTFSLDFGIPGYTPHPDSPAIGVHAVGAGPRRELAVVMAGLTPPGNTPPVVAVLQQPAPRVFVQPTEDTTTIPPAVANIDSRGISLVTDLGGLPGVEMVISARLQSTTKPVIALHYNGTKFVLGIVEEGSEKLLSIRALHAGIAFPADPVRNRQAVRAVFVMHESDNDGVREQYLSTMLVVDRPSGVELLAPDAGGPIEPVRGLASGNFTPGSVALGGTARDLAAACRDPARTGIQLLENDGFGALTKTVDLRDPAILPETIVRVPRAIGALPLLAPDRIAYLTDDGRLATWEPGVGPAQPPTWVSSDLRLLGPPNLRGEPLAAESRIVADDIDGDGVVDLAMLLVFDRAALGEDNAVLLILRGRPAPAGGVPFELPLEAATVHGNARDLVLGDFVSEGSGAARRLELAVAVPVGTSTGASDGDHVRFFRLRPGSTSVWERSYESGGPQVLLAGNNPTRMVAADFDGTGTVDLVVASEGDASLRLLLNSGRPASDPSQVAIDAFQPSHGSPMATTTGLPTFLRADDINGDGNVDVLFLVADQLGTPRRSSVGFYLSNGNGQLSDEASFVSQTRLGEFLPPLEPREVALVADLGDFNGDGVPDLAVAWNMSIDHDRNLRVLFGGAR